MKVLEAKNISLRFGGLVAVSDVSFALNKGEILAVIGPNGAGKTSLFNVVTGLYQASEGRILFLGKPLELKLKFSQIVSALFGTITFALSVVVAINAQELWDVAIVSRYIYEEGFRYFEAFSALIDHCWTLDAYWSTYPFLFGFVIAIAALSKFWQAARFTPVVAAKAGLARTFQNIRLFGSATVAENIRTIVYAQRRPGLLVSMLKLPRHSRFEKFVNEQVQSVMEQFGLSKFANVRANSLPYGLQRRLEIARALAARPQVLLLDEPAAGLNASESQQLLELVRQIRDSGVTVLLIEHDMSVVMAVSDRIVVLHHGEKIAEGTPTEVRTNPLVIKAYLGAAAVV